MYINSLDTQVHFLLKTITRSGFEFKKNIKLSLKVMDQRFVSAKQKYSRLRCLLRVKSLMICFYLGWSGSILQFRQNMIKVGSKSWLLTCSSNITLSLPSYTGSALKRELNFCNGYLSLLYFCVPLLISDTL